MPRDAGVVDDFLSRVRRRLVLLSAAEGAAAGLAVGAAVALVGHSWAIAGGGLAVVGIVVRVLMTRGGRRSAAALVERRVPTSRNLLFTASEIRPGETVSEPVATLIHERAAELVRTLDAAAIVPVQKTVMLLVGSAALWGIAARRVERADVATPTRQVAAAATGIEAVDVVVTPPAYSRRAAHSFSDPSRVDALVGSRIRLTVRANAARIVVETLSSRDTVVESSAKTFTTEVAAAGDGFIAIEPQDESGRAGPRRLIALTVTQDEPPKVRISTPGKDLVFADGRHTIDISANASDDIELASLELRYTKVSGSGERFTFKEGTIPIQVARTSDQAWTARTRWRLDDLALEPGDMVVYRAVAADLRPGAAPSESDAFIVEIRESGGDAAGGFSLDPEQERYAVSQQMVILKTEKLASKRSAMPADSLITEAREIAIEQRKVRAEFVFMMGGELADAPDASGTMDDLNEEAEAAGEDDLLAGRAANQGRQALMRAIRAMSHAATSLDAADLATALKSERAALAQLEQAFSRTRILLRALSTRERLDLSRRLTGAMNDISRVPRVVPEPEVDTRVKSLRRVLSGIAELAASPRFDADASQRASLLAQSVLRIDASAISLQEVATTLNAVAAAIGRGNEADARGQLDRAATGVAEVVRAGIPVAPAVAQPIGSRKMAGALVDALRKLERGR